MAKETQAFISISRLIQDADIPDNKRDAVLRAIMRDESIPDALLKTNVGGFSKKVEDYFIYGRDTYLKGLPHDQFPNIEPINGQDITTAIETILTSIEGVTCTEVTQTNLYGIIVPDKAAKHFMHMYMDYVPSTNAVNADTISSLAIRNDYVVQPTGIGTYVGADFNIDFTMDITFTVGSNTYTYTYNLPYASYDDLYLMIEYTKAGDPEVYTWTYAFESGEYSNIFRQDIYEEDNRTYYPLVPIVSDRERIDTKLRPVQPWEQQPVPDPLDIYSQSGLALLRTLGIDGSIIATELYRNPDYGNIMDSSVLFAPQITDTDPAVCEYFFRFFQTKGQESPGARTEYENWVSNGAPGNKLGDSIQVWDEVVNSVTTDGSFDRLLYYNWIYDSVELGVIGDIGEYSQVFVDTPDENVGDHLIARSSVKFLHQYSTNHYRQIEVQGIGTTTRVYVKETEAARYLKTTIREAYTLSESEGCFFPLARESVLAMDTTTQERLFYRSLSLVTHVSSITDLEWYETAEFAAWVRVVGLVIAVVGFSPQITAILEASSLYLAATLVVELVIETILIDLLIDAAFTWIADNLDTDLALILAAVVAVAAIAYGVTKGVEGLPFVTDLLNGVSQFASAIQEAVLDDFVELQSEMEDYYSDVEEKEE